MALESLCNFQQTNLSTHFHNDSELEDVMSQDMNLVDQMQLGAPPYTNPLSSRVNFKRDEFGREIKINMNHGTTTLGFVTDNGVIIAADSRATGGSFIGSQVMKKIVEVNKYLLGTLAGGAADCVYWYRVLSKQCRLYELRNKERISTAAASKIMSNIAYSYKGMGLSMGLTFAGWDKRGPSMYYVDSEGSRTKGTVFSVGSGSVYALGVLDSGYRKDLPDNEAYELARRAIFHATFRDPCSGGIIRVYHMKKDGWEKISEDDCQKLYDKYHYDPLLSNEIM